MADSDFILVLAAVAIPVTCIDLWYLRIPDVFTLGGMGLLSLLSLRHGPGYLCGVLLAAGLGTAVFLCIRFSTGRKLGLGDVKYSGFLAGALGIRGWLLAMLIASLLGLLYAGAALRRSRPDPETRMPFAPFLSLGAAGALLVYLVMECPG